MITLSILCMIWGIISYFRIRKVCKQTGKEFTPFEGSFVDYLGFVVGFATFILSIVILSNHYLP